MSASIFPSLAPLWPEEEILVSLSGIIMGASLIDSRFLDLEMTYILSSKATAVFCAALHLEKARICSEGINYYITSTAQWKPYRIEQRVTAIGLSFTVTMFLVGLSFIIDRIARETINGGGMANIYYHLAKTNVLMCVAAILTAGLKNCLDRTVVAFPNNS